LADNDCRRHDPRFAGEAEAHNRQLVSALAEFAQARGFSNAQLALAWLFHKPLHLIPIAGTRRIVYLEIKVSSIDPGPPGRRAAGAASGAA